MPTRTTGKSKQMMILAVSLLAVSSVGLGGLSGSVAAAERTSITSQFNGSDTGWQPYGNATFSQVDGTEVIRLTRPQIGERGAVVYSTPIPSEQPVTATFRYYSDGGSGADGIAFLLLNNSQVELDTLSVGSGGGSLGYSGFPGIQGGYMAVGFDEYGNFKPEAGDRTPQSITIRGAGDEANESTEPSAYPHLVTREPSGTIDGGWRWGRITINTTGGVSDKIGIEVDMKFSQEDDWETVIDQQVTATEIGSPTPANFLIGFSSATGASTNLHAIDTLNLAYTPSDSQSSSSSDVQSSSGSTDQSLTGGDGQSSSGADEQSPTDDDGQGSGLATFFKSTSQRFSGVGLLVGIGVISVGYLAYRRRSSDETIESVTNDSASAKQEATDEEPTTMDQSQVSLAYSELELGSRLRTNSLYEIREGEIPAQDLPAWIITPSGTAGETIDKATTEDFLETVDQWASVDSHEHLTTVYGHGNDPLPWIATEPADGQQLGGDLAIRERLDYLAHVCEAIHHVSRYGVEYDTLTPESILVDGDGDLQLRGVIDEFDGFEASAYQPPEDTVDSTHDAADVYRVGAVAYEILTGEQPTAGGNLSPPSTVNPDLPAEVDSVILKAMAKTPEERYETVLHLRDSLSEV